MSNTEELGHGSSPAAWIAVTIMLVAVGLGTIFLFLNIIPAVWASAVLFVIGLAAGGVLKRLGYGVDGPKTKGH